MIRARQHNPATFHICSEKQSLNSAVLLTVCQSQAKFVAVVSSCHLIIQFRQTDKHLNVGVCMCSHFPVCDSCIRNLYPLRAALSAPTYQNNPFTAPLLFLSENNLISSEWFASQLLNITGKTQTSSP